MDETPNGERRKDNEEQKQNRGSEVHVVGREYVTPSDEMEHGRRLEEGAKKVGMDGEKVGTSHTTYWSPSRKTWRSDFKSKKGKVANATRGGRSSVS